MKSAIFERIEKMTTLMSGASVLYGAGVRLRTSLYRKGISKARKLPCPVISVGNITAGGTGKTPMTMYLANLLKKLGYSPAIVSRGYRGKAEKQGGIVSDGIRIRMSAEEAGDEPFMMASNLTDVPVLVGQNRFRSGMRAIREFGSGLIVLDDGFQHLKLHRDIDLVLLDSRLPFGNGHLLPRGVLREPLSALCRADVFVMTRYSEDAGKFPDLPDRPVFRSFHVPLHRDLRGRRVFAFSGIADNRDFLDTTKHLNGEIAGFLGFADHHPYSPEDLDEIERLAKAVHAELLVTTEKDHARIAPRTWSPELSAIGIGMCFGNDAAAFEAFIRRRIRQCI